ARTGRRLGRAPPGGRRDRPAGLRALLPLPRGRGGPDRRRAHRRRLQRRERLLRAHAVRRVRARLVAARHRRRAARGRGGHRPRRHRPVVLRPVPAAAARGRRPRPAGERAPAAGVAAGRVRPGGPDVTTDVLDVIRTKRDGGELSDEQIRFFVEGYTAGTIADEQAAALCMAILLRDMAPRELAPWTRAMIDSGQRLDPPGVGRPTVDKPSTGGVADKVWLPHVPLVAACGAAVP